MNRLLRGLRLLCCEFEEQETKQNLKYAANRGSRRYSAKESLRRKERDRDSWVRDDGPALADAGVDESDSEITREQGLPVLGTALPVERLALDLCEGDTGARGVCSYTVNLERPEGPAEAKPGTRPTWARDRSEAYMGSFLVLCGGEA
ncbi:hypothetical protein CYMTET_49780 [Cymbomonas tetramitiformis]|uniref:Uncharacterized protein n=1 Tax=Cymbomonas tetramitiformis TaxID=36881 RepID=A0AAE0BPL5_9CHLO|nr:hypothetical protein CYMTET_49780 [Cymbomonas tetramitiformis]